MRILLYTYTALPKLGGQEAVVDSLARQFVSKGHAVTVLAPYPRQNLRLEDGQYPYEMRRHPRFRSTRFGVSWYQFFLRRALRERPFDILHCHGVYPSGYVSALVRKRVPIPFVLTAHGGDVYENNLRLNKPGLRDRFVSAVRTADRLIAISQFTEKALTDLGADTHKIVRINNGVDTETIERTAARPLDLDPSIQPDNYFLFIGRLKHQKGVDILLRAMALLSDAKLVIAGDGAERAGLELLTGQLNLNSRVKFVGPVHGETKNYLFQNCICTIVPSRMFEAFGLVVIESYAVGRPVIVTDHPGLADLVQESVTGFIVDPENPEQLASAMSKMINQSAAMRPAATKAAQQYAWSTITDQHLNLYNQLNTVFHTK